MTSAPCPILERYEGILTCNDPVDCDRCPWMMRFLDEVGGDPAWECHWCLAKPKRRVALGFYATGRCDGCGEQRMMLQVAL